MQINYIILDFNPLRREGGDCHGTHHHGDRREFQSTPPRGRRHGGVNTQVIRFGISIHSAARAETITASEASTMPDISIHSAARAETSASDYSQKRYEISIHSAARAETCRTSEVRVPLVKFQSTPPRGRRQNYYRELAEGYVNFNPLRREGGDT